MRVSTIIATVILGAAAASAVPAQEVENTTPCKDRQCRLYVEWGSAGTPTTVDRRYGALGELQSRTLEHLNAAGSRFSQGLSDDAMSLRLRPQIVNAMCDVLAGTNPDMTCRVVGDVVIDVLHADPALKLPSTLRIRNRCGADQRMEILRFSEYLAAMILYELDRGKDRKRPSTKC